MKFAVGHILDQTCGYYVGAVDGSPVWTTKHAEAHLFENEQEAEQIEGDFIEDVLDETEFRARPDTWNT